MTERYEREDFRLWLTSFEPDALPFQQKCPLATWQQHDPDFKLYFESLCSDWMSKFILCIDESTGLRTPADYGHWTPDWSMVTAKDALGVLDSLEIA